MERSLIVEFTKMEGAGNDFIVIDNRFFRFSTDELAALALKYCVRRTGIGADGLLALEAPTSPEADFRMRYRNADGSLGTMCGNGARCIAVFARLSGFDEATMVFETDAGRYTADVSSDLESVTIDMPPPFPKLSLSPETLSIDGAQFDLYRLWTGTEHVVAFVDDVDGVDVASVGAALRAHAEFAPAGTNVNFVEASRFTGRELVLRVRTYEKGVERETLACGTGAVAVATAAMATGRVNGGDVRVQMRGGILTVRIGRREDNITSLTLEGPVREVFRGTFPV